MSIAEHDAGHYLKAARQLATSVAANADRIDRERQIPPELAGEIADQGFFPAPFTAIAGRCGARPPGLSSNPGDIRRGRWQRRLEYEPGQCVLDKFG